MKSLKFVIINAVTLIIGLGLVSGSFSEHRAQATAFETIPSLKVGSLKNFRGQYLTVLYAVGSRSFLSGDAGAISLSQVKDSRTAFIAGDELTLPATHVAQEGFRPSYNMVIFVISAHPHFSWHNADGQVPQGMSVTANQRAAVIHVVNKSELASFMKLQGDKTAFAVQL